MGVIQLASAENVSAIWYDDNSFVLRADGQKPSNCRNVTFDKVSNGFPYMIFELNWTMDTGTLIQEPYVCEQTKYGYPEILIVKTREFPQGKEIPVQKYHTNMESVTAMSIASLPAAPVDVKRSYDPPVSIPRFVREAEPFELEERIPSSPEAQVEIKYDDESLQMIGSSYRMGNIIWKFKGLKVGYTTVVITVWTIPGEGCPRKQAISVEPGVHTQSAAPAGAQQSGNTVPIVAPQTPSPARPGMSAYTSPPPVSVAA